MKILKQHIGGTVIAATLLVLLILVGVQVFIAFVRQLSDLGSGDYGLWQAVQYVVLTLPGNVYSFFPMAGLLGCLMGLGYLASNSELVVMRASGVSLFQIIKAVLGAAVVMLVVMVIFGELIAPYAMHLAQTNKAIAESGGQAVTAKKGLWVRDGQNFIHINRVLPGYVLQGVSQYRFDKNYKLLSASYAKQAILKNKKWVLNDVSETTLHQKFVTSKTFKQKKWPAKMNLKLLNVSDVNPNELTLVTLYHMIHYRQMNKLNVTGYALTFWQRIFQPISTLVMIFLAIPFIFGPLRSVTMGVRIVTGVVVGFVFYLINQFFGPLSLVYQLPPLLGAILPSLLFAFIGYMLMRRAY